jgi:hypothetical protein
MVVSFIEMEGKHCRSEQVRKMIKKICFGHFKFYLSTYMNVTHTCCVISLFWMIEPRIEVIFGKELPTGKD